MQKLLVSAHVSRSRSPEKPTDWQDVTSTKSPPGGGINVKANYYLTHLIKWVGRHFDRHTPWEALAMCSRPLQQIIKMNWMHDPLIRTRISSSPVKMWAKTVCSVCYKDLSYSFIWFFVTDIQRKIAFSCFVLLKVWTNLGWTFDKKVIDFRQMRFYWLCGVIITL